MSDFDDERQRSREAILKRRAKLVAVAVAAGVAVPSCGGKSSGVCLSVSYDGGTSSGGELGKGGSRVCLSPPLGGTSFCLSIAAGTANGGTQVCLSLPYGGESSGGAPGAGGAGEGGAGEGGEGGSPPIFCLAPPFGGTAPIGGQGGGGGAD